MIFKKNIHLQILNFLLVGNFLTICSVLATYPFEPALCGWPYRFVAISFHSGSYYIYFTEFFKAFFLWGLVGFNFPFFSFHSPQCSFIDVLTNSRKLLAKGCIATKTRFASSLLCGCFCCVFTVFYSHKLFDQLGFWQSSTWGFPIPFLVGVADLPEFSPVNFVLCFICWWGVAWLFPVLNLNIGEMNLASEKDE